MNSAGTGRASDAENDSFSNLVGMKLKRISTAWARVNDVTEAPVPSTAPVREFLTETVS